MTHTELIALVPTVWEPLKVAGFQADLKRLLTILDRLSGLDRMQAYGALADLKDLFANISELPAVAGVSLEEWQATKRDFCRAVEMYLEEVWEPSAPETTLQ